ncbi:aminotransferase class IV [Dethiobacter alkaliphilus]|uniref:Aminotransferase class IV n=1 Tax=Dethiobacter alkaliphilus AHT 1 TaxID=555088 RepID=C0GCY2_DETAL|nr:aminotransferase class IV [Dethiobacter alkaliphilus]EEG79067.1 aminotransferase class IV [Dethiobacter alkaliphilus AHT 1]
MTDYIFLNGTLVMARTGRIGVTDRSYLLGDGLFETILVKDGKPVYLQEHLRRLLTSCTYLQYQPPTKDVLCEAVQEVIAANSLTTGSLRLTVSPGESQGLLPKEGSALNILVTFRRGEPYAAELYERGFRAIIAQSTRRNEYSPLSHHKTTNFLDSILARKEAQAAGCDEAILVNTSGHVAEGSVSNLFIVQNGQVLTPRVEDGALAGIMRHKVLELCQTLSIPAGEESLTAQQLEQAEEAFLTNSLLGVMPLAQIQSTVFKDRTITDQLAKSFIVN